MSPRGFMCIKGKRCAQMNNTPKMPDSKTWRTTESNFPLHKEEDVVQLWLAGSTN